MYIDKLVFIFLMVFMYLGGFAWSLLWNKLATQYFENYFDKEDR